MNRIVKDDLVTLLADANNITLKDAHKFLDSVFEIMEECFLKGYEININKFGMFKIEYQKPRSERLGVVDPRIGEKGIIPPTEEYNKLRFATSKALKAKLREETLGNAFKDDGR